MTNDFGQLGHGRDFEAELQKAPASGDGYTVVGMGCSLAERMEVGESADQAVDRLNSLGLKVARVGQQDPLQDGHIGEQDPLQDGHIG
jgi:hypothetical protein